MKLSVLIPTLPEPFYIRGLKRLNDILDPQIARRSDKVEKVIHDQGRSITTGRKRNELIKQSVGEFVTFVDSDDIISDDYVDKILFALEKNPDVVTFEGEMTTNGAHRKKFVIRLGEKYEERNGVYYRHPNHLAVIRRSIIEHVPFPDKTIGEDYAWCCAIKDKGLLKTSVHISKNLYLYDFWDPKLRK